MSSLGFPDWQEIQQWFGSAIAQQTGRVVGAGSVTEGPFVLSSWASIILAIKPTGGAVTVTITQAIDGAPASLTTSEAIVVPAGSTAFIARVLFGNVLSVTITGTVPGTAVDYSLYPSNTTTNAQVITQATINMQHNDVLVAAEPTIDFVDDFGVTWTVTDDAANTRVRLRARPKREIITVAGTADVVATNPGLVTVITTGVINVPFAGDFMLEWFCAGYLTNQTAQICDCYLEVDGVGDLIRLPLTDNTFPFPPVVSRRRDTLTAGNHTFDVLAGTTGGTCTFKASAGVGGYNPMLLTLSAV